MENFTEQMNASQVFCPNLQCMARGQVGQGNIVIHGRQRPRYRCTTCGKTFSAKEGTMFAGLSVADGQVYGTCRARHCFADFQAFVQQVIVPQAVRRKVSTVVLILENGTTHAPKQLEGCLQRLGASLPQPLHFAVHWLLPNASWLDQIEIWFSILQRKRLQPNPFRRPEDLEHSILDFVAL